MQAIHKQLESNTISKDFILLHHTFVFLCVVFHFKTNLASKHTKGKRTFCFPKLFLENNTGKNICVLLFTVSCVLVCILIAEQRKNTHNKKCCLAIQLNIEKSLPFMWTVVLIHAITVAKSISIHFLSYFV